ncbi:hypothetical protein, partial [Mesorhizobium sp. M7A.F.Ca.CA.002.05.1.1]|uniref:hypothetical protein n=1 Tax=Mesorhizobium sp. M7A.F.Ca.CA.002.05.1.1 TaxID=2496704 RepID=UPI0019D0CA60
LPARTSRANVSELPCATLELPGHDPAKHPAYLPGCWTDRNSIVPSAMNQDLIALAQLASSLRSLRPGRRLID